MTVNPIPDGYTTVTPWIISRDTAALIDYVKAAFDGEELGRMVGEGGTIGHAEVRIGNAVVMMFDARPDWPPTPGSSACTSTTRRRCSRRPSPPAARW
ncbi:hypothetical protein ACFWAY_21720 [Rhodococcus sp. NPDC059968]|uniref:hypothetical protein n=1 Tax=Rhodococcus sp. NPDC059968 TaxID=3347017 RepID=UPI00366F5FF5